MQNADEGYRTGGNEYADGIYQLGKGAVNIPIGVYKAGKEAGAEALDTVNDTAYISTGHEFYNGSLSNLNTAALDPNFSYTQHVVETSANVVTFGTYGEAKTIYQVGTGQISVDDASQQLGAAGVFQYAGARVAGTLQTQVTPDITFTGGNAGEAYLAENFGGRSQVPVRTTLGIRFLDQLSADGDAQESKVGFVGDTETVQTQIAKDAEILQNNLGVQTYNWNFFRSGITGKIGADPAVLDALRNNGISYTVYDGADWWKPYVGAATVSSQGSLGQNK